MARSASRGRRRVPAGYSITRQEQTALKHSKSPLFPGFFDDDHRFAGDKHSEHIGGCYARDD